MENHYSASYDVDLARKYGLEVAALFNKLVYLSRYTSREDGFCWRTAKELEEELGISKFQQERATKILEKLGLIETKVTYIQGTMTRCKHFKLCANYSLSESKETLLSVSQETSLSVSAETSLSNNNNHTVIIKHNNKKETYKEKAPTEIDRIVSEYTDNPDLVEVLKDFAKFRKAIKAPLTDRAMKICLNKLDSLADTDERKIKVVEQSIERGWKGFFELKDEPKQEAETNPDLERFHIVCEAIE